MIDQQLIEMPEIAESAILEFKAALKGQLVQPGDAEYDSARKVWNVMFDRYPALIAYCADTSDVVCAVTFARDHGLPVAVRSGGHSVAGHSTINAGLIIDLSNMKEISIDPERRTARAQAGLRLRDLDQATHEYGLAVPAGTVSDTGIAGLTVGGGTGWLMRKWGLTIDNLLSVEIVTANGQVLTASKQENADLFWGIRGGGGNFGIVTTFEYQLHPVSMVLGGPVIYTLDHAAEVLRFYREFMETAPNELTVFAAFMTVPPAPMFPEHLHGQIALAVDVCYAGPIEEGEQVVAPLRQFGEPALDMIGPMPFTVRQSILDDMVPDGMYHYDTGDYLQELSDEAIDTIISHMATMSSPLTVIHLARMGGAVADVPEDATAFSGRQSPYLFWILAMWPPADDMERHMQWIRATRDALRPYTTGGAYVNALTEHDTSRVRSLYGETKHDRLVALKNRYDPTNFFRLNQNIRPSVSAEGE